MEKLKKFRQYCHTSLLKAAGAVLRGTMNPTKASTHYRIPCSTIRDYAKRPDMTQAKSGRPAYLSPEQDAPLQGYVQYMSERGFPMTTPILQNLAQQLTGKEEIPTVRWAQRFVKNHGMSSRRPNVLSQSRVAAVTSESLKQHFNLLKVVITENDLMEKPENIYKCYESGWSKDQQFALRVIAQKGIKHPFVRQAFTHDHVTTMHCGSAAGELLPTMVIVKGCNPMWSEADGERLAKKWLFTENSTGFMNSGLFVTWLSQLFIPAVRTRNRAGPILLPLDNASCHLPIRALEIAKQNNIIMFGLLLNASGVLQPFDQLFKDLKLEFYKLAHKLCLVHTDFIVNKAKFPHILRQVGSDRLI